MTLLSLSLSLSLSPPFLSLSLPRSHSSPSLCLNTAYVPPSLPKQSGSFPSQDHEKVPQNQRPAFIIGNQQLTTDGSSSPATTTKSRRRSSDKGLTGPGTINDRTGTSTDQDGQMQQSYVNGQRLQLDSESQHNLLDETAFHWIFVQCRAYIVTVM